jgi:hypothetical protein
MKRKKGGKQIDASLSYGNHGVASHNAVRTTTTDAGSSSSGAIAGSTSGEWVWDTTYSRYRRFNSTTGQWEWQ